MVYHSVRGRGSLLIIRDKRSKAGSSTNAFFFFAVTKYLIQYLFVLSCILPIYFKLLAIPTAFFNAARMIDGNFVSVENVSIA